jgi:hypothetical protein
MEILRGDRMQANNKRASLLTLRASPTHNLAGSPLLELQSLHTDFDSLRLELPTELATAHTAMTTAELYKHKANISCIELVALSTI